MNRTGEKLTVALVGNPNVGKSVVFNALSGAKAAVSNYPGTTVGLSHADVRIGDYPVELVDTPGMYSLLPITEEEVVGRAILLDGSPDLVVHVIDAKNLERMLSFTIQLMESGFPIVVALNMMDEALSAGVIINIDFLQTRLAVPVIPMVAVLGKGIPELKEAIGGELAHARCTTSIS